MPLFLLLSCAFASEVHHEVIPKTFGPPGKVEFFWQAPEGEGPFPVFIMVHGHQGRLKKGASLIADSGAFKILSSSGMVAVAVSQSGYGLTDGKPDHAGKNSQEILRSVIRFFKNHPAAAPGRIILFGTSMGATLAAVTATQETGLAGIIIENGMYDVEATLKGLWLRSKWDPDKLRLYRTLDEETDGGFSERSALLHADRIKCKVLILAGLGDEIALPEQSLQLHQRIEGAGGKSQFILYPFAGHNIPEAMKGKDLTRFLAELKGK